MRARDGRTLILITQRCTTAMFADAILVLDGGRVAGFGGPRALLETCETYGRCTAPRWPERGRRHEPGSAVRQAAADRPRVRQCGARFAPGQKARDERGTLMRVAALYKNQKAELAAILGLTVASAVVQVLIPYWTGRAFNAFVGGNPRRRPAQDCLTAIVLLNLSSYVSGTAAIR
jgi:ABC-type multidrug transport system fused ATPase/permease subunit